MSDFIKRLRLIEAENSECSILAGNCADAIEIEGKKAATEILRLRAENEKLRAERDLWISRFEDFRKNAARLEEARSRPMRLVGSAAAALKETGDE